MKASGAPVLIDDQDAQPLIQAIDNSLKYYSRIKKSLESAKGRESSVTFGNETVSVALILESLMDFKNKLSEYGLTDIFFRYVKENYRFFQSSAKSDVLFTGYYEADLRGSLSRSEVYRYPLYRTPDDLYRVELTAFSFFEKYKGLPRVLRGRISNRGSNNRTIVPYYNRQEIDYKGKLEGRGLEIVWIDNPIDVFFLHIQGSGIVTLDNGKTIRVNYDESNGHPYFAIGRLLVQQGVLSLEDVSMQSIQSYLEEHPEKLEEVLGSNPSYVFFREVEEGPIGALGVPVTAFRSIAVDRFLFPAGTLCYIQTRLPELNESGNQVGWKNFSAFVMNQDTGGAIRGPHRVDLFTGYGKKSKLIAGHMKRKGKLYFLLKK